MTTYRVFWKIDIDADTPAEACAIAREIQLDPSSEATRFDVFNPELDMVVAQVKVESDGKGVLL